MMKRYDVALVGAGLIGPALANVLARNGFRVAMLDPLPPETRDADDFDGRAYAIAPGSQKLLATLDVWRHVAEAQPISAIEVADSMNAPLPAAALHFDPADCGASELGWIVEDRHLRAALIAALPDSVDYIAPATAMAEWSATSAVVRLGDATFRADLVVACDGRRSATARGAGIGYLQQDYDQIGLVCAIAHDAEHAGLARQRFFPGGPFAVLPLRGRRSALVWSERTAVAQRISRLSDSAYLAELDARLGQDLGRICLEGRRWTYPLGMSLAERYVAPRLALCGDAAHGVHPIAGQGLNMGLRDVAALGEVLVEAARIGEDIGAVTVLERYQQWRRFDATSMALGMGMLNRLFSTDGAAVQAVRNLGLGLVGRVPVARRMLQLQAAGKAGDVPRLLTGQPI